MALHTRFRTHTLTVERPARTADGAGGWIESRVEVGTVTGSLQPGSAAEQTSADQERALARWVFYCDPGADLGRDDHLIDVDGRRFLVLDVLEWADGSPIEHVRVDVEQVQHGA